MSRRPDEAGPEQLHHRARERAGLTTIRTVLLANRRLGAAIGHYLERRGDLVGVVVHPERDADHRQELMGLGASTWTWPEGRDAVAALKPECLFSVLFGYKLPASWLCIPSWYPINLHPGLLPYNRLRAPYAWPLVDGTPAGTTLYVMDERLDCGPVLWQELVPTYHEDTAATLFRRLEAVSLVMVTSIWPRLRDIKPGPQRGEGTAHPLAHFNELDLGPEDMRVIDRLRARTFPPRGAEFVRDGVRYRARIEIERVD